MALKSSMKILLVDESASMRQSIKKMLTDLGFKNVSEASDGDKAWTTMLDSATEKPVEFIIYEWNVPKTNGIDFLKKVRGHETFKKTAFLMMTADSDQQKIVQAVKEGVNNVIVKPFSAQTLIEKIDKIFNKK
ncbi:MAG: chemotaxis response regulator CheY [Bdellovibrio sp.]